jgi:hypothetical protein
MLRRSHHTESLERLNKALGLAKGTPLSERMAQSALKEQLLKGCDGGSSRVESSVSQSSKKRIQSLAQNVNKRARQPRRLADKKTATLIWLVDGWIFRSVVLGGLDEPKPTLGKPQPIDALIFGAGVKRPLSSFLRATPKFVVPVHRQPPGPMAAKIIQILELGTVPNGLSGDAERRQKKKPSRRGAAAPRGKLFSPIAPPEALRCRRTWTDRRS